MKALGVIIFTILFSVTSQAPCEMETYYPDAGESVQLIPPTPVPVDKPPPPAIVAAGEVRTVDKYSNPRLWGKGRDGAVRYGVSGIEAGLCRNTAGTVAYGLSRLAVSWGAAVDACPEGTWVCNYSDFGGYYFVCDTDRPGDDLNGDYFNCNGTGVHRASSEHVGWVAGAPEISEGSLPYKAASEEATISSFAMPCFSLPVWCCSGIQP